MSDTVFNPLTTVFTPPASCSSHWTYEGHYYNDETNGVLMQRLLEQTPDSACYPTSFLQFARAGTISQIYSPGVCPLGYVSALTRSESETTIVVCCLSNFEYLTSIAPVIGTESTEIFHGCTSTFHAGRTTTVPARSGVTDLSLTTLTATNWITMWAQPITIGFEERDRTLLPTISSKSSSTSPSSASSNTNSSSSSPSTNSASASSDTATSSNTSRDSSDSGISGGAIGGIAVAVVAIIAIAVGSYILNRRRRARRAPKATDVAPTEQDYPAEKRESTQQSSAMMNGYIDEHRQSEPCEVHEIGQGRQMRSPGIPTSPVEM